MSKDDNIRVVRNFIGVYFSQWSTLSVRESILLRCLQSK